MKFSLCLLILLCGCLEACMNVATTGAQAIYHRHDINNQLQDYVITTQAYKSFEVPRQTFADARVVIVTLNKEVLIAGQVPTLWQKKKSWRKENYQNH